MRDNTAVYRKARQFGYESAQASFNRDTLNDLCQDLCQAPAKMECKPLLCNRDFILKSNDEM